MSLFIADHGEGGRLVNLQPGELPDLRHAPVRSILEFKLLPVKRLDVLVWRTRDDLRSHSLLQQLFVSVSMDD